MDDTTQLAASPIPAKDRDVLPVSRFRPVDPDIQTTVEFLRRNLPATPKAAVVLGSGLGEFVHSVTPLQSIPYTAIPGIPRTTAVGHAGWLHTAEILETPTVILQGRCHRYEGYSRREVSRLVRALCALGLEKLVVSCAAGGLNPRFRSGDLMVFDGHVDLLGQDAESSEAPRPRSVTYSAETVQLAEQIALEEGVLLRRGTYAAVLGPNYETRAEIRWLRQVADAVGMSSIPEILAATQQGVQVLGLAMITNECQPDLVHPACAAEVLEAAGRGEPRFRKLVLSLLARCSSPA